MDVPCAVLCCELNNPFFGETKVSGDEKGDAEPVARICTPTNIEFTCNNRTESVSVELSPSHLICKFIRVNYVTPIKLLSQYCNVFILFYCCCFCCFSWINTMMHTLMLWTHLYGAPSMLFAIAFYDEKISTECTVQQEQRSRIHIYDTDYCCYCYRCHFYYCHKFWLDTFQ